MVEATEIPVADRCTVHSTQYTVHSTQYTVHSTQYTVHSTQYTVHSTQYTVHSTQYTVHSTQYTVHCVAINSMNLNLNLNLNLNHSFPSGATAIARKCFVGGESVQGRDGQMYMEKSPETSEMLFI